MARKQRAIRSFGIGLMTGAGDPSTAAESDTPRPRLLLLFADAARAAALAPHLSSAKYEVVSSPLSVPADAWTEWLEPDLILLDLPSEEKEVFRTCEAIRAQTECPVVALSELRGELLVARLLALGIDDYFALPIGGRELAARIDALLRRLHRYAGSKRTRQVGDLLLRLIDRSVEVHGRKVYLSPIEFRLLSCLVSAPGKVLTHQTLMSRVWGTEYGDARNCLRVYIRSLRQKLEKDPAEPRMILCEWGVGYRFEPPEAPAS